MTEPIRSISYGGGVQSTSLLVLAAQGKIDFPLFLMANVGDDSEHPATLKYVREVAAPYAAANGIELHLLDRVKRDGTTETLYQRLVNPIKCPQCAATGVKDGEPCERCGGTGQAESRSLPIPIRMSNGAPGNRSCTADFKIKVIGKWLKQRGASADNPATIGIGISLDEIHRANSRRHEPHERIVYPLLDLRLRRGDCAQLIADAGLPVPPKSSCYFCPFHKPAAWEDLARDEPELFQKSVELERTLNKRREHLGRDPVWLTYYNRPLDEAISGRQETLPLLADSGDGECDSGWCFT